MDCDCKQTCPTPCDNLLNKRVKLGYVADSPTSVQLVDSYGNQIFDMLPIVQAGETDTSIELISATRRIRYYPEEYTRTEGAAGCYYDICIPDIANLIDLGELRNVADTPPSNGSTIVYNTTTNQYEIYDLSGALSAINTRIDNTNLRIDGIERTITNIQNSIAELQSAINQLNNRLGDIEAAIYNWANDKSTKIPRGTINITSGGPTSNWIIQSREKNQDNDLDFQ